MAILRSCMFAGFTVAFLLSPLAGQEEAYDEVRAKFEKFESSIQIVLKYDPVDDIGKLELVEDQQKQLKALNEEYQSLIDQIKSLGDSPMESNAKMALFVQKMDSLTKTLNKEILLPHQSVLVESLVFSKILKHRGGSWLAAIQTYYRDQFNLSDKQKEEFKTIEKKVGEEIAEAKEKFLKEVEQIKLDAKKDINAVLEPEQKQLLERLEDKVK